MPVPEVDALLDAVERFAATFTGDDAVSDVLRKLAEQVAVVLGVSGVGVVLVRQGRLSDVIATVEAIADLERVVAAREIGPCADAIRSRQPVVVGDLTGGDLAQRWPEYVAQAEVGEIRAVAAVPMVAGERVLGVLGLYDGARRTWTDEDLRVARIMANIASCYLVHASELGQGGKPKNSSGRRWPAAPSSSRPKAWWLSRVASPSTRGSTFCASTPVTTTHASTTSRRPW